MRIDQEALTFDDVLLVPDLSKVLPKDVQLASRLTRDIAINIPVVSAAMDTVTESHLAIALAEEGGIGILHKNMSIEAQAAEVRKVKKFESGVVRDPITVTPKTSIREVKELARSHNFSGMPVIEGKRLVGIITNRDFRFETDLDKPVINLMTPQEKLVTVKEGAAPEEVLRLLHKHRIEKILVVNEGFQLRGMITVKDILKAQAKPYSCRDASGQLRVGAAVGTGNEANDRIQALIKAGADVIVVDTAHGHSKNVLDKVRWIKKHFPEIQVIAGNIATGGAAEDLAAAGVDAVKVGIGPGSICTTRIVAGVGIPQITAIANVAAALKNKNIPIIADGGIRFSGDVGKALGAGAWSVMIGGLFAGCEEAPGELELYQGRYYKSYRGMGSVGAMAQVHGSKDRYFQHTVEEAEKLVPEGIEGRVPYKGNLVNVVHQLMGGLRSSMGYTGCMTIEELREKAHFVRVTSAGVRESHVHDVMITKEAPNYWKEE